MLRLAITKSEGDSFLPARQPIKSTESKYSPMSMKVRVIKYSRLLSARARRRGSYPSSCSKWVRATFRISHQQEFCNFSEAIPVVSVQVVPLDGVEPSRACAHRFLRPACIPIPPQRPHLYGASIPAYPVVNVKFYCGVPPTSAGQAPLAHIIDLSRQRLGQK